MQRERDWLNSRVFPRIREELAKRRHHLEPIDLRLGVETAQARTEVARELLVLKVCLDEIKRSRPFLLVLLGDRYGWVPPEERIEAAAREQGFETSPAGKSVTALEIEFGILKDEPGQKRRSLFFFRRPLPYATMPGAVRADYSDAHSPDARVREGHAKLAALKDKLARDSELAGHIHEYSAGWDPKANHGHGDVAGLDAFGELVFEKLWGAIDEETKDWASLPAPTWEEQERAAIAEFVEHRSRGFVGRGEIIGQLLDIARSPAVEGPMGSTTWCACVTGSPGSGKSAVFARLHRELSNDRATLLLANAVGGTARGSSVDSMLRRWIGELTTAADVADPLPPNASNDDIEAAFHSLLRRVAAKQRIVVLLDALDQFEPTPRGRHLTSFKARQWPPNARIIATSIPCPATEELAQWAGFEEIELPPLIAADARAIGKEVWDRYHRELNPAVLRMLVEKKLPDGQPACGNPLWLTLALEQLNLLDADDFARAKHQFTGSPTERMTALLLDTARRMPPEITDLYGWLLEQNEKAFGIAHARGFAVAVALSRSGWRESDLLDLVPRLAERLFPRETVGDLNDLALASMRRGFRAHIVRRGVNGQLDFFHAQMRRAVIKRCEPEESTRQNLHASISDFLEKLPDNDPLIRLERMGQLIGEHNAMRAGRYYATFDPKSESNTERLGSTWNLLDWIVTGESRAKENANLGWIISWLEQPDISKLEVHLLAHNLQYDLFPKMENDVALPARQRLVESVRAALMRLAATDSSDPLLQFSLSVCHQQIGDVLLARGNLAGALLAYREKIAICQRIVATDPSDAGWQHDLASAHCLVGGILEDEGDFSDALEAYQKNQAIMERLVAANPSNVQWRNDLSLSKDKIANVLRIHGDLAGAMCAYREALAVRQALAAANPRNAEWQRDLSVTLGMIGNVLRDQGDLVGALRAYQETLEVSQRLAAADPGNVEWQHDLSVSQGKIGDMLSAQGDLPGALKTFREEMAVSKHLAAADPNNTRWQRALSVSQDRIGDVLRDQGDLVGAVKIYRESLTVRAHLAELDPSNVGWQRDLSESQDRIGDVLRDQGDLAGALKVYSESMAIRAHLEKATPSNAGWQRYLGISQRKIGDVLLDQGDLAGAVKIYRESLTITARLVGADPSNAGWQHDLSVSHIQLGNALVAQGDLAGALRAYRESLTVRAHLAELDPSNAGWQRDLSVSNASVGDVLLAQGDLTGASRAYRESMAVRMRLAEADPSNSGWQRDLVVGYVKLAQATEQGSTGDARDWWRKAYDQLGGMKQRGIMLPKDEKHLPILRNKVEGSSERPSRKTSMPHWLFRIGIWLVWLLVMALAVVLARISLWYWIVSGPVLLIGMIFVVVAFIPSFLKRFTAWAEEVKHQDEQKP